MPPRRRTGLGPLGLLLNLLAATTLVTVAQARDPTLLPPRLQVDSERRTVKLLERKDAANGIATFSDYTSRVIAYRDRKERMCYLERMTVGNMQQQLRLISAQYMKAMPPRLEKTLYTAPGRLSKIEVWQLAGRKVAEFCRGLSAALLQPGPPGSVVNELPVDENDVRVFQDPEMFKLQRNVVHRTKRQTNNPPGRKYRGQSQSQFVTFRGTNTGDSSPGGIAEGTSQHDRAVARVSASNGMGQAQSQSSFDDDCEGCSGRSQGIPPDPISRPGYTDGSIYYGPGSVQTGYPSYGQLPSGRPGLTSDGRRPGQLPGGYPGSPQGSPSFLIDGQRPGQLPGSYPGSLPDGQRPGHLPSGYPSTTHGLLPGGQRPGQQPGGYPSSPQGPSGLLTDGQRPGQLPGGYPSSPQGTTGLSPGGYRPEKLPGGYPSSTDLLPGGQRPGQLPGGYPSSPHGPSGLLPGGQRPGQLPGGYPSSPQGPAGLTSGGYRPGQLPGSYPSSTGLLPDGQRPGQLPGGHPSSTGLLPDGQRPGQLPGGYPSSTGLLPDGQRPGQLPGGYPTSTGLLPDGQRPGQLPAGYPSSTGLLPDGQLPGGYPSSPHGPSGLLPVGQRPGQLPGGYPSSPQGPAGLTPGGYRPGQLPGGYPSSTGLSPDGQRPGQLPGGYPSSTGLLPDGQRPGQLLGGYPSSPQGPSGLTPGQLPGGYPSSQVPQTFIPGGHRPEHFPSGHPSSHLPSSPIPTGYRPGQIPSRYPDSPQGQQSYIPDGQRPGQQPIGLPQGTGFIQGGQGGQRGPHEYPSYPQRPSSLLPSGYTPGHVPGGYPSLPHGPSSQIPGGAGRYPAGVGHPGGYPSGSGGYYDGRVHQQTPGYVHHQGTDFTQQPGSLVNGQQLPSPQGTVQQPEGYTPGSAQYPGYDQTGGRPIGYPSGQPTDVYGQVPTHTGGIQNGYPPGTTGAVPHWHPGQGVPSGTIQQPGIGYPGQTSVGGGPYIAGQYPGTDNQYFPGGRPQGGLPGQTVYQPGYIPGSGQHIGGPQAVYQPGSQIPGQQIVPYGGIPGEYQPVGPGDLTTDVDGRSQVQTSVQQENNETLASSSAQGHYGQGKAQTQVSGSYKGSGSFSAQAQTSDSNRGAQSQVLGGSDGATSAGQAHGGSGQSQAEVKLASESGLTQASSQTSSAHYGSQTEVQAGEMGGNADAQARGVGNTQSQAQVGFKPYQSSRDGDDQTIPFRGGGSASAQTGRSAGSSQSQVLGAFRFGISYSGAAQASTGTNEQIAREGLKPLEPLKGLTNSRGISSGTNSTSRQTASASLTENSGASHVSSQSRGSLATPQPGYDAQNTRQHRVTGVQASNNLSGTPRRNDRGGTDHSSSLSRTQETRHDSSQRHEESYRHSQSSTTEEEEEISTTLPPQLTPVDIMPAGSNLHASSHNDQRSYTSGSSGQRSASRGSLTQGRGGEGGGGLSFQTTNIQGQQFGSDTNSRQPTQSQSVILGNIENYGVHVIQDADGTGLSTGDVLQPGQRIPGTPGYVIPGGLRGRVVSTTGEHATATSDPGGQAQTQTVILTPGSGNISYTGPSGYHGNPYDDADDENDDSQEDDDDYVDQQQQNRHHRRTYQTYRTSTYRGGYRQNGGVRNIATRTDDYSTRRLVSPDSYVSVTKSVTGKLDDKGTSNSDGSKYAHTYYTKSSTCGYFTFSCNIVYGSNGRTKICRPKAPTNPDGTPCCC